MALPQPSVYQDQYYRDGNLHMTTNGQPGEIRYTTDGSAPTLASTLYSAPIPITWTLGPTTTYKVAVFNAGDQSPVVTWTVSFYVGQVVVGGQYGNGETLTFYDDVLQAVSCETPGVVIRYTDDGSEPTDTSLIVTGNVLYYPWTQGTVLLAFAAFIDGSRSNFSSYVYYKFKVDDVKADPPSSVVYGPTQVTLDCRTPNTNIRYTLDGTVPGPTSQLYSAPISVVPGTVLRAEASIGTSKSGMLSCVYDYEHKSHNPSLALDGSGNITCVYEKTQNQKPGWPLAGAEPLGVGAVSIASSEPITSTVEPGYMFWVNPTTFNQTQPQSFSNMNSTFVLDYADTFSALSMFCCTGNTNFVFGLYWNQNYASLIENAEVVGGQVQDSRFMVKAVSRTGVARLWIRNVSGTDTLFLNVSDFAGNTLSQASVAVPTTDVNCFLNISITSSGVRGGIAFNSTGDVPASFTSVTSVLEFDDTDVGFEIENTPSSVSSGTCEVGMIGFSVTSDSGKFMREPAGITFGSYTYRSCGLFSRTWDLSNIDYGCFDTSVSRSGSIVQSDRLRGGFLMGFLADEYLSLSTHAFGNDFDIEIPINIAYGGKRNDGLFAHFFRIAGSEFSSSLEVVYRFNSGSTSGIDFRINGSSVGLVPVDYFNPPRTLLFKFVRTGSNLTLSVSLNSGAFISFSGSAPPDAGSGMSLILNTNACEADARTPSTVCVEHIKASCSNLHFYGVGLTATLHGWYGMLGGNGFGWHGQEITLPASTTGLLVYSKTTSNISIIGIDAGWDQTTSLVVGIFRTHSTGIYEYAPVINSSLVCSRQVSWEGVLGAEKVLGVGSNPKITEAGVAWESAGDVVSSTATSPTLFPYASYRGYSNSITKPPRRLRSYLHVPVKTALYTEIPQ